MLEDFHLMQNILKSGWYVVQQTIAEIFGYVLMRNYIVLCRLKNPSVVASECYWSKAEL